MKVKYWEKVNLMWLFLITVPFFVVILYLFRFSPHLQFQILTLAALVYLMVALLYHWVDKTLTVEITIEYALIAALALIIFSGLLL